MSGHDEANAALVAALDAYADDLKSRLAQPSPPFVRVEGVDWCVVHGSPIGPTYMHGYCYAMWGPHSSFDSPCRFVPLYIKEES